MVGKRPPWPRDAAGLFLRHLEESGLTHYGRLRMAETKQVRSEFRARFLRPEWSSVSHCPGCRPPARQVPRRLRYTWNFDWEYLKGAKHYRDGPIPVARDLPLRPSDRVICFPERCDIRAATFRFIQILDFEFWDDIDLYWLFPALPTVCIAMTHEWEVGVLTVGL